MGKIIFPDVDLTGVKGVLLDLDNTLYDYKAAHEVALRACYNHSDKSLSYEKFATIYRNHRTAVTKRLYPQGSCRSRILAFQGMFEELKVPQAFNLALEFEDFYWNALKDAMILIPQAEMFLKKCKGRKIPVCIVSDMTASVQIQKLKKLGIDSLITYLVTSEEVGVEKPDEKIYRYALDKLGLTSSEVVMIGDDFQKDLEGSRNLDIKCQEVIQ